MANDTAPAPGAAVATADGMSMGGMVADFGSDQRAFKKVHWGKACMWIFLLSDTFIFGSFLVSYMTVRMSTTVDWPIPSQVFGLTVFGTSVPLLLIAIMTFILISSSGTMAMAVNFGYRRNRKVCAALMIVTAIFGATFVGMQAFEWSKLIEDGVRPWGNPIGRPPVRLHLLHDHRISRFPRVDRRHLSADCGGQGAARGFRSQGQL